MIENPDSNMDDVESPRIYGNRSLVELRENVLQLHILASKLKQKRIDNGALRLEVPKLVFSIDSQTGLPDGCSAFEV